MFLTLPPAAYAGLAADCDQATDLRLKIGVCTELDHSGRWSKKDQANSLHQRGVTHQDLNQHKRAVRSFGEAGRPDPSYTSA